MRFATWNLNRPGAERARRQVSFLSNVDWDIVVLQEVTQRAWNIITGGSLAEDSFYALEGFGVTPSGKYPHGVALLTRNGFHLSKPRLIPGLPKAERALTAEIIVENELVTVAGWHAPNAAGEGVTTKMQGYRGIVNWLDNISGPTVFGFDSNHWSLSIDLDPPHVPNSKDRWLLENQFFGNNALHRLRDVYLDHLREHPAEYEKIKERRPHGPLAVSYVRNGTEDRFDYIFVSDEVRVSSCSYDYEAAKSAGSDHGIVVADLILRT
jgi:exonuclease III